MQPSTDVGKWLTTNIDAVLDFLNTHNGCALISKLNLSVGGAFKQYVRPNTALNWHFAGARLGLIGNPESNLDRGPTQYRFARQERAEAASSDTPLPHWITSTVHWDLAPQTLFIFNDQTGPHRGLERSTSNNNWLLSGYIM